MQRFFLHFRDGQEVIEDPDGYDFPNLAAAREEAAASIRDVVVQLIQSGRAIGDPHLEIWDDTQKLVATIRLPLR